jgi:hypothetical protein
LHRLPWGNIRYGLKQAAIEAEGKTPSPKQLRDLVRRAKGDHAK